MRGAWNCHHPNLMLTRQCWQIGIDHAAQAGKSTVPFDQLVWVFPGLPSASGMYDMPSISRDKDRHGKRPVRKHIPCKSGLTSGCLGNILHAFCIQLWNPSAYVIDGAYLCIRKVRTLK
jgi:hypothetical protein